MSSSREVEGLDFSKITKSWVITQDEYIIERISRGVQAMAGTERLRTIGLHANHTLLHQRTAFTATLPPLKLHPQFGDKLLGTRTRRTDRSSRTSSRS